MEHLRYKPKALFRLDDASSPFLDYSGYGKTATLSGTMTKGLPLSTWNTNATLVDNSNAITFASAPVYIQGMDVNKAFSITASVYPIARSGTAPQQIVSSSGKYDGLSIQGTVLSFTTTYTNNGTATASYDLELNRRFDVVGVHTSTKNSLYVDGKLVAEVDIDALQQADTYNIANANLYSGGSTGTNALLLNMVGLYDSALSPDAVVAIYEASNRRSNIDGLKSYNGHEVLLGRMGTIYEWKSDNDWNQATLTNCAVEKDTLFAQTYNGVTFAAEWTDTIDMSVTSTGLLVESVDIYYIGENVLVEASVDNTTWQTVTVGDNLTVAPKGFSADNFLFLRATFASGVAEARLTYLGVRIYTDNGVYTPPVSGRSLTFTNPTTLVNTREPMGMYEDNGLHLNHAPLKIGADPSDLPIAIQTVELWFRAIDELPGDDVVLVDTRSAGTGLVEVVGWNTVTATNATFYRNGRADASLPITKHGWNVVHLVLNSGTTGDITINGSTTISARSGNIQLGKVVLYEQALTANDIAKIVANYTGVPVTGGTLTGGIVMAESVPVTAILSHDWTAIDAE